MTTTPDFDSIQQRNVYDIEFWSARDLAPLLGYNKWERFHVAIQKAITACEQSGNKIEDHFPTSWKQITAGKGAKQKVKDYLLSRLACYLVAQNGDPPGPSIRKLVEERRRKQKKISQTKEQKPDQEQLF